MVAMLSSTGMSTRAIAPVVGTTRETVRRDIAAATDTNVSVDEVPAETVTGLNGKTYARPIRTPKAPNYPGEYRDAVISLNNAVHRLLRTHEDKRMARNAQKVATVNRSDAKGKGVGVPPPSLGLPETAG